MKILEIEKLQNAVDETDGYDIEMIDFDFDKVLHFGTDYKFQIVKIRDNLYDIKEITLK